MRDKPFRQNLTGIDLLKKFRPPPGRVAAIIE